MDVTDVICDGGLSQSAELIAAIDQRLDGAAVASARPEAALRGVALFS
jgi:hypothetical protein